MACLFTYSLKLYEYKVIKITCVLLLRAAKYLLHAAN